MVKWKWHDWTKASYLMGMTKMNEPPRFTTTLHSLWNHDFQNLIITPKEKDNPSQIIMHMYLITFLAHPHFLPFFSNLHHSIMTF